MTKWSLLHCNSCAKHLLPLWWCAADMALKEGGKEERKKGREGERKKGSRCDGVLATFWWCPGHVVTVSRSCCDGVPVMLWWCPGWCPGRLGDVVMVSRSRFDGVVMVSRSRWCCDGVPLYILLLGSRTKLFFVFSNLCIDITYKYVLYINIYSPKVLQKNDS